MKLNSTIFSVSSCIYGQISLIARIRGFNINSISQFCFYKYEH